MVIKFINTGTEVGHIVDRLVTVGHIITGLTQWATY